MHRSAVAAFLCLIFVASISTVIMAESPPVAPIRMVVDDHWGVKVEDPYRYLENINDPEVQAWFKGQSDYAAKVLGRIPGRDKLLDRITELDAGRAYGTFRIKQMPDGKLFYQRQAADENLSKLYWQDGLTGEPQLLIDPATMTTPDGGHYSLYFYRPSPDGSYVIYGLSPSGSENVTLHVLDIATGEDLPETIDRLEPYYTPPQWLPDGSGFTYVRLQELAPEAPVTEGYKNSKTYLHRLGDNIAKDQMVFARDQWSNVAMTTEDFPSIVISPGSDYMLGKIKHGDANQLTLYAAPLNTMGSADVPWRMVCDVADSVSDFAVRGENIYLLSSRNAPRYRVLRTSLKQPSFANAAEVIPTGGAVLKWITTAKDALYGVALDAGMEQIFRLDYTSGTLSRLLLPDDAPSGWITSSSPQVDGILAGTASWTKRGGTYAYDPRQNTFTDTGLNPRGKYDDPPGYESIEVHVPSHDGVEVPLSIVFKSGITLDGSHPTILSGYGSYGSSSEPYFSPKSLAWLERGGIMAFAHVRGGGEYGIEWHLAGQKLTKPNTWKDFIACAEYLIDQGYTSSEKLAGRGRSAGGILIGRAITARPDLFGVASIEVGSCDMIRVETTTNGIPNIQEFGTVTKEDEFHGLLAMSAYHHVKDGVEYPAVLLIHGINDPRVDPWISAKMCARLQAASGSDKPILFRVDYHAGHGIGSTKKQGHEELADRYAFMFWQLGHPDFQP